MKLYDLAHARAGDKGNISNISVIAFHREDYARLCREVTAERVQDHFAGIEVTHVDRYELPLLGALNFVLHNALAGGVTATTALDPHGKSLSGFLLEMEV